MAKSGWNMDQAARSVRSSLLNLAASAKKHVVADRISCIQRNSYIDRQLFHNLDDWIDRQCAVVGSRSATAVTANSATLKGR